MARRVGQKSVEDSVFIEVFVKHVKAGNSRKDVASELGVGEQAVYNRERKLREKLLEVGAKLPEFAPREKDYGALAAKLTELLADSPLTEKTETVAA